MSYRIEDKKRRLRMEVETMSEGLAWLKRSGRRGDVLRGPSGRILAKAANGFSGSTYGFLKDAETENGNAGLHELSRKARRR